MDFGWDDLRLFLDVARLGGLTAASKKSGVSAATLGRRITVLERQFGEPLFNRSPQGYAPTVAGEELLKRAEEVEGAMQSLARWRDGELGRRVVRISAGFWTTDFLARHADEFWTLEDGILLDFVTAQEKVDIGHRAAEIGIRGSRPVEPSLAGRKLGHVAYALYGAPGTASGVRSGMVVGATGQASTLPSARWLASHHGDRIVARGNSPHAVRELAAQGAGMTVLPCFIGDADPRLARMASPIPELTTEHWLVLHHEERHSPPVRKTAERIATVLTVNRDLFAGECPFDEGASNAGQ